jgi:hypothetical protein
MFETVIGQNATTTDDCQMLRSMAYNMFENAEIAFLFPHSQLAGGVASHVEYSLGPR